MVLPKCNDGIAKSTAEGAAPVERCEGTGLTKEFTLASVFNHACMKLILRQIIFKESKNGEN